MDLSKIKLIIWDLDDTLWRGTLSEGGVDIPAENLQLIVDLTEIGIINSICSKNDYEPTKAKLQQLGIWDYFVFPSINWGNKGQRIKRMIDQMALRPVNVLFIDDNTFNLQEAKHHLPEIQIATPDNISNIIDQVKLLDKKDATHKRLKQYKVLEEKAQAAESFDSNEEFLYASNIRVTIHTNCVEIIERLYELILRSNQLNFTKKRISLEELSAILINANYDCGYVTVTDKYGDYGVIGFYAKRDNQLEHFVFSCRTMGQMIEQYVYALLGFPELNIVGEVRTQLNKVDCPAWINQNNVSNTESIQNEALSCRILLKGPCDLSNSQSYICAKEDIITEFTYVKEDNGQVIDTYNHSLHIRGLKEFTEDNKREIIEDCAFVDEAMLQGTFFTGNYDVIFLSSLIESVYPIYKKKGSSTKVVYRKSIDEESDRRFFEQYEWVGYTAPEEYKQFLLDCLRWLPQKTTLCIILGATLPMDKYKQTAVRHAAINNVVKELANINKRLRFIDVDDFVKSEKDITDSINHYQTRVYYEIAQAMIRVINGVSNIRVSSANKTNVWLINILKKIRSVIKNIISPESRIYQWLQQIYFRATRRKSNVR